MGGMRMNIVVCASDENNREIVKNEIIRQGNHLGVGIYLDEYSDRKEFIEGLKVRKYNMAIIILNGIEGMETAISAREQNKNTKIAWISNENDFGMQSIRINASYFASGKLTNDIAKEAVSRCLEDSV